MLDSVLAFRNSGWETIGNSSDAREDPVRITELRTEVPFTCIVGVVCSCGGPRSRFDPNEGFVSSRSRGLSLPTRRLTRISIRESSYSRLLPPKSSAIAVPGRVIPTPSHLLFNAATTLLISLKAAMTKGTAIGPSRGI